VPFAIVAVDNVFLFKKSISLIFFASVYVFGGLSWFNKLIKNLIVPINCYTVSFCKVFYCSVLSSVIFSVPLLARDTLRLFRLERICWSFIFHVCVKHIIVYGGVFRPGFREQLPGVPPKQPKLPGTKFATTVLCRCSNFDTWIIA